MLFTCFFCPIFQSNTWWWYGMIWVFYSNITDIIYIQPPLEDPGSLGYTAFCLGLQKDGTSCGFWVATFALLRVFEIDLASPANKKVLKKLGVNGLKTLWQSIIVNYLQDSTGLQASILQEFLSMFSDWKGFPNSTHCVSLFNLSLAILIIFPRLVHVLNIWHCLKHHLI